MLHMTTTADIIRSRRGSVLVVAVLIALVAAGVALVAVRGSLGIERQERMRSSAVEEVRAAESAHERLVAGLRQDPLLMLERVLEGEAPRFCDATGTEFHPGSLWPDACGAAWGYLRESMHEGVMLAPPSSALYDGWERPSGSISTLSLLEGVTGPVLIETVWQQGSLRPVLHTQGSLVVPDGAELPTRGLITAGGDMILAEGAQVAALTLMAGGEVQGEEAAGARAFSGVPELRTGMRESRAQVLRHACISLCLVPGGTFVDVEGTTRHVPEGTRSVRLGVGGDRLTVHASSAMLHGVESIADAGLSSGRWGEMLGEVEVPASGIVHVSSDLLLEACVTGAHCGTYTSAFTLLAGDATSPVLALASGPILRSAEIPSFSGLSVHGNLLLVGGADEGMPARDIELSLSMSGAGQVAAIEGSTTVKGAFMSELSPELSGSPIILEASAAHRTPPYWPLPDLTPTRSHTIVRGGAASAPIVSMMERQQGQEGTVPTAPELQSASLQEGALTLWFEPPSSLGYGTSAISYQYSLDDGRTWEDGPEGSTTSPLQVTVPSGARTLSARIRAVTAEGPGIPSTRLSVASQ